MANEKPAFNVYTVEDRGEGEDRSLLSLSSPPARPTPLFIVPVLASGSSYAALYCPCPRLRLVLRRSFLSLSSPPARPTPLFIVPVLASGSSYAALFISLSSPPARPTPLFIVPVLASGSSYASCLLKIGAAWPHKDGKGYNVTLSALPPDNRLVLRVPTENDDEPETAAKAAPEGRKARRS